MTPLAQGTRIGSFEVVSGIGAGGMGEVYRARDLKLDRDIALKVLPEAFAGSEERLARFEREARLLAALNHPNIAQVYGIEAAGETRAIAMELVPGLDLAQRLSNGPMALDEILASSIQIAAGLEAAHEQGIVHRDLKPANIKLRPDGGVKILDFGLAKAFESGAASTASLVTSSPTLTTPFQMSGVGMIVGTAPYMSPEQARGQAVDKRADIWAFGCVLYEMLTGTRAFPGHDAAEMLAAVIRAEPDWSLLPPDTPANIRTLLRRTLTKNPRERLPDIGAARLELRDATLPDVPGDTRPTARHWVPWMITAFALLAAVFTAARALNNRPAAEARVSKTVIIPPAPLPGAPMLRMAISPDGRRLAFIAPDASGKTVLWVRRLDEMTAQSLPDTIGARAPFWSPDSNWIGFVADGRLRRVTASGGAVLTVCNTIEGLPGSWNRNDVILFSGPGGSLRQVSAKGGEPTVVRSPETGENQRLQIAPFFLPDQQHFLFSTTNAGSRVAGVYVGSLNSETARLLLNVSSNAIYASGYVLFLRDTMLMAQRFDPARMELIGSAVPLGADVQVNPQTGTGAFSVSDNGVLVYQTGTSAGTQLGWRDRSGKKLGLLVTESSTRDVQLSPNDSFASITLPEGTGQSSAVWILDLARGLRRRFTFGGVGYAAVWSPDSKRLAYTSMRDNTPGLYLKNANGVGEEELLLRDNTQKYPLGFTRDGRSLLYAWHIRVLMGKLMVLPLVGTKGTSTPELVLYPGAGGDFSRRTLADLCVRRDRQSRGLRHLIPQRRRAMADLNRTGGQPAVAARRQRTVFHVRGPLHGCRRRPQ